MRSIETAVVIRDDILGAVPLACSRRPAFYNRIKLPGCVGCLKNSFLKPGAGDQEKALANELAALEGLTIEAEDQALVGQTWHDREDRAQYTLTTVEWSLVDSHDGKGLPGLNGSYKEVGGSGKKYWSTTNEIWSTMNEIREWVKESKVSGALSDRELRSMRRAAASFEGAARTANAKVNDGTSTEVAAEDAEVRSLLSLNAGAYIINEILQRAVMPGGAVWYQVSYGLSARTAGAPTVPIHVWEHSSDVPRAAVEHWRRARTGFAYSSEERELLKECGGSLKENQNRRSLRTLEYS